MQRLKTIILIGFIAIISLVSLSIYVSLSAITESNERLTHQINIHDAKINLVTRLRTAARGRSLALARMLMLTDDDKILKEYDNILINGGIFVEALEEYQQFDLNKDERRVIKNHRELADTIAPMHHEIADMILFGEREHAKHLLLEQAVPMQDYAFENLSNLIAIQRSQGNMLLLDNKLNYQQLVSKFWLLFIAAFTLSMTILFVILRVISRNETLQKQSKEGLEALVDERTHELIESHDRAVEATLAAQRANKAKSDFLSRMSHELRTPLNSIIGFSSLIIYSRSTDDRTRQRLQHIKGAGEHLLNLIDEVLDLTKIETGKIRLKIKAVRLKTILEQCRQLIEPLTDEAKVKLNFDTDMPYVVIADSTRLEQAMINLLTNAIKYNRMHGQVTVSYQTLNDTRLRISITDTGIGITNTDQKHLFEPFQRLGAEYGEVEGTGIGLTITRQLVELMDGTVGVSSEPGQGSTFWIDLNMLQDVETIPENEVAAPEEQHDENASKKIVYVEDNSSSLVLMQEIIEQMTDHDLMTAENGEDGLELILNNMPDIALLDINLPDMDGYEILERLRKNPKASKMRIIAITANAMPADIESGKAAGFDSYLTKPLKMDELLQSIA